MKNPKIQALLVLALTFAALWGLLAWDPFRHLRDIFVDPVQEKAKISFVFTDPNTQEVSDGQNPLESLRELESNWCNVPKERRYILTGNSQTFSVLLSPSEALATDAIDADRTYPDLLLDRLNAAGGNFHGYRLSAPNISYMEVLWYLNYLSVHECLIPGEFVIQLNFETFRKTGVREGMLELLKDPDFASAIKREAHSNTPYAGTFQQAIDQYESRLAKEKGSQTASTSKTGLADTWGAGSALETNARAALDRISLFRSRGQFKAELSDFLYLARVNILGITPTTKRSLGGGPLTINVGSLERIGELCRRNGIRLVFFNAPQNPNASLYRTSADREQYQKIVSRLAHKFAQAYFDFENSIPGPLWGVWIDGPDPIHFGRAAHHLLAALMFEQGVISGKN